MLDQNQNNHYRQDEEGSDGAKQPLKTSDGFEKGDSDIAPEDRGNAVYLTFLLYGIGVLLPFNVILACLDFYGDKVSILISMSHLCDFNIDARLQLRQHLPVRDQRTTVANVNSTGGLRRKHQLLAKIGARIRILRTQYVNCAYYS